MIDQASAVTADQPETKRGRTALHQLLSLWWIQLIALWLVVLLTLNAAGHAAVRTVELGGGIPASVALESGSLAGIWARWDSGYYLEVSQRGYAGNANAVGFFPLFPLLIAGLSWGFGISAPLAGMIIAQSAYLAAILVFYQVARRVQDDHAYAMRSTLFFVLFPSSFFNFAIYAESLYLALTVAAVFFALRACNNYVIAGGMAGLASLSRPVGWLIDLILLGEFIIRRKCTVEQFLRLGVGLFLSIAGIVAYVLYLYQLTGTLMAIPAAQAKWLRQWQYPWITLFSSIENVATGGDMLVNDWFLYATNLCDLLFTLLALALTLVALRKSFRGHFPWSLSLYLLASLAFLLSSRGPGFVPLWGMTRWVAALFPLFLVLGSFRWRPAATIIGYGLSASLQILFTMWWISGRWVG